MARFSVTALANECSTKVYFPFPKLEFHNCARETCRSAHSQPENLPVHSSNAVLVLEMEKWYA
jgi:hypothetical protein